MRFIHCNQTDWQLHHTLHKLLTLQPFGRHVQKPVRTVHTVVKHHALFFVRQTRIDSRCQYPAFAKIGYLVFHQCNQRCDNQTQPFSISVVIRHDERRHLKAQRLAAPRRQQCKRVFACQHRLDDLLLLGAEIIITEVSM